MPGIASAATAVVHRPRRRRHLDDPRRRGRHHAAQPRAAGDRRAVRHAGVALPGPHRSRPRPRARHRPADRARAAPRPGGTARTPSRRTWSSCRPTSARPARPERSAPCPAPASTCRSGSSARASSARSSPPLLGLPFAFASHFAPDRCCGRRSRSTARDSSRPSSSAQPYVDARRQRVRGRHRRRGAAAVHLAAAGRSSTCGAARPGRCRRRSTRWTAAGPRPRRRRPSMRSRTRSSARPRRSAGIQRFVDRDRRRRADGDGDIFDHPARLRSFEIVAEVGNPTTLGVSGAS